MIKFVRFMLISLILPVILGLVSLFRIISYTRYVNDFAIEQAYNTLADSAKSQITTVNSIIEGNKTILTTFAYSLSLRDSYNIANLTKRMDAIIKSSNFSYLAITFDKKTAHLNNGSVIDIKDFSSNLKLLSDKSCILDIEHSVIDNKTYLVFGVPIIYRESLIGHILGYYSEEHFSKTLFSTAFLNSAYSFICDSKGEVVVEAEGKTQLKLSDNYFKFLSQCNIYNDITCEKVKSDFANGTPDTLSYSFDKQKRYATYLPCGVNNWMLINVIDKNIVDKSILQIRNNGIVTTIVIMLCAVILLLLFVTTEQRRLSALTKSQKKELEIYSTDKLTGLCSKTGFETKAAQLLKYKNNCKYVIIDIDICNFSAYNSLNGRENGDKLLKCLAEFLKEYFPRGIYARLYGDHFVVMTDCSRPREVVKTIIKLNKNLLSHINNNIRIIFGIYEIVDDTMPINNMIDYAKYARQQLKSGYKFNKYISMFNKELKDKIDESNFLISQADSALRQHEFFAMYQPKYHTKTKTLSSAEALVRWKTKSGKIIGPNKFIELFEKNGKIKALDFYILELVCKKIKDLESKKIHPVPISVNFSKSHLYDTTFPKKLLKTVQSYGVPTYLIEIEFTEATLLDNFESYLDVITKIKEAGFSISIDDFGKEYSSLSLLANLPFDIIKIDRCFLNEDSDLEKSKIILKNMIHLSKDLGLLTVAEGVETKEQYELLKSLECNYIQGYYFSKPLTEDAFTKLLIHPQSEHNNKQVAIW